MKRIATGALALSVLAACPPGAAGAQWRGAPAGVTLRAPAGPVAPLVRAREAGALQVTSPRYPGLGRQIGRGALIGALAGTAAATAVTVAYAARDESCGEYFPCPLLIPIATVGGTAVGAFGGFVAYSLVKVQPRPAREAPTTQLLTPVDTLRCVREAVGAARVSCEKLRDRYFTYGLLAGAAAGVISARFDDCVDCWLPADFIAVPVGSLVGVFVAATLWDYRYLPRPRPRAPVPALPSGLARYMLIGAAAGGAGGVLLSNRRCDDCSASGALVQNVPLGAAVGAIGGALVHAARYGGRAADRPVP